MKVTRVYRFSASHRLHAESLSCEQNAELYGKCNNPYGHGHDYILHISVTGEPDSRTGRVVNFAALDRYVQERLLRLYDHSDLNSDVPGFQGVPTTENLVRDSDRRSAGTLALWAGVAGGRVYPGDGSQCQLLCRQIDEKSYREGDESEGDDEGRARKKGRSPI